MYISISLERLESVMKGILAWIGIICLGIGVSVSGYGAEKFDSNRAERYLSILLERPENTYLFEKVYSTYANAGKIYLLIERLRKVSSFASYYILSKIHLVRVNYVMALEYAQKALKLQPKSYLLWWHLGKIYAQDDQPQKAIEALEKGYSLCSSVEDKRAILKLLGEQYFQANLHEKALEAWRKIRKIGFVHASTLRELIAIYEKNQFYSEAIRVAKEIIYKAGSSLDLKYQTMLKLAELYNKSGDPKEAIRTCQKIIENTSSRHWIHGRALELYLLFHKRQGTLDQVLKRYQRKLQLQPGNLENSRIYAKILLLAGKEKKYEKFLKHLQARFPRQIVVYYLLMQFYRKRARWQDLFQTLLDLYKIAPYRAELIIEACAIALKIEKIQEARRLAEQLSRKFSADASLHYRLAKTFQKAGDYKIALKFLKKALRLQPENRNYLLHTGELYLKLKKPQEALKTWKKIVKNKRDDEYYEYSQILFLNKFYKEALQAIEKAIEKNDRPFKYHHLRAKCLASMQKISEAFLALAKASQKATLPLEKNIVRKMRIHLLGKSKKIQITIQDFQKKLQQNPDNLELRETLAEMYKSIYNWKKAAELYESILKSQPGRIEVHKELAKIYSKIPEEKYVQKAISQYQHLIQLDPFLKGNYYFAIAELYLLNKKNYKALEYLDKARKSGSTYGELYYKLSQKYLEFGKAKIAKNMLKKAVMFDSRNSKYAFELAELHWQDKEYFKALSLYASILEMRTTPAIEAESKTRLYQKTLELASTYLQRKKYSLVFRLYRQALRYSWSSRREATLRVRLLLAYLQANAEPLRWIKQFQILMEKFRDVEISVQSGYICQVSKLCKRLLAKLPSSFLKFYQKYFSRITGHLYQKAINGDTPLQVKIETLKKIIYLYPFSLYAGKAILALIEIYQRQKKFHHALELYYSIFQKEVYLSTLEYRKALLDFYSFAQNSSLRISSSELRQIFRPYIARYPELKKLIAPSQIPPQTAPPPLTFIWAKKNIMTEFSPPLHSQNKIYVRVQKDLLISFYLDTGKMADRFYIPSNFPFYGNNYRYFKAVIAENLYIYGGLKLQAFDLKRKKVAWILNTFPDTWQIELLYGGKLRVILLGQDPQFYYVKDLGGKLRKLKKSEVLKIYPLRKKNSSNFNELSLRLRKIREKIKSIKRKILFHPQNKKWIKKLIELNQIHKKLESLLKKIRYPHPSHRYQIPQFFTDVYYYQNRVFVYEAIRQWLFCLDPKSGNIIWMRKLLLQGRYFLRFAHHSTVLNTLSNYPPIIKFRHGTMFIMADRLYALSIFHGKTLWIQKIPNNYRDVSPAISMAIGNNKIFISTYFSQLIVYDFSGRKVFSKKFSRLILKTYQNLLCALDPKYLLIWPNGNLARKPIKLPLFRLLSNYYFRSLRLPPPILILDNFIYVASGFWLQAFRYETRPNFYIENHWHYDAYSQFSNSSSKYRPYLQRYANTVVLGPYHIQGRILINSPYANLIYVFKSLRVLQKEILSKIQASPTNPFYRYKIAQLYQKERNYDFAIQSYQKSLKLLQQNSAHSYPVSKKQIQQDLSQCYFQYALRKIRKSELNSAIRLLKRAEELKSNSLSLVFLYLGFCYENLHLLRYLNTKISSLFSNLVPEFLFDDLQTALGYYLKAFWNNPYQTLPSTPTSNLLQNVKAFVFDRLTTLVQYPPFRKVYFQFCQNQVENLTNSSSNALLSLAQKYPFSQIEFYALYRAANILKAKSPKKALSIFLKLKTLWRPYFIKKINLPTIYWRIANLYSRLGEYKKALLYYTYLEENYIKQSRSLPFEKELAIAIETVLSQMKQKIEIPPPPSQKNWKIIWKRKVFFASPYTIRYTNAILANRKIFFFQKNSGLIVLDAQTGKEIKRFPIFPLSPSYTKLWTPFKIFKVNNLILGYFYRRYQFHLYAIDIHTLQQKWKYILTYEEYPKPRHLYLQLQCSSQYLFALSTFGYLHAIELSSGKLAWRRKILPVPYRISLRQPYYELSPPYGAQNPLLLADEKNVYLIDNKITAYSANTGKVQWQRNPTSILQTQILPAYISPAVLKSALQIRGFQGFFSAYTYVKMTEVQVWENTLIVLDTFGRIYAFQTKNGELLWYRHQPFQPKRRFYSLFQGSPHLLLIRQTYSKRTPFEVFQINPYTGQSIPFWYGQKRFFAIRLQISWSKNYFLPRQLSLLQTPNFLYLFYDKIYLYSLDASNLLSSSQTLEFFPLSSVWESLSPKYSNSYFIRPKPILKNNTLYLFQADGLLYAYKRR
ncbi:MAG: tetratricopeptide repeat protein [Planctomycetota bacterium]|nr:MAG: tetratricopeptide repeat protein [Planctomycetota bacterium]